MAKAFPDYQFDFNPINEDIYLPGNAANDIIAGYNIQTPASAGGGSSTPISSTETITTPANVSAKISERDYVATIEEVLDTNRVRVSLSYNDGVNQKEHKGDDQVSNKFVNFRVNYIKNNINRYKTYLKVGNDYYLIINSKLSDDGTKRVFKLKQALSDDIVVGDRTIFVEKRLENYRDRVKLVPFEEQDNNGIFLRLPNFNSVDNPINFQGTNFSNNDDLLSNVDSDTRDIERQLISGSLLDVQPNIDYQKRTTSYNELDDTGFGNFIHFSNAERRIRNFRTKLELIEGYNADSSSLLSVSSSLSRIQGIERKRQRVINSFDPYETFLYFESSSYVSSSEGQFHDTSWPKTTSSKPYTLASTTSTAGVTWFNNIITSASSYDFNNPNSLRNSLPEHVNQDTTNNVFLEFMDMVGQQFDEIWTYTKSLTDVNVRVEKLSEGISKDVARNFAKTLGLDLVSGNDIVKLPNYVLGKDENGTLLYESPQEQLTEEIWKRILANLPFFIKAKGTRRAMTGLLSCYGIPSSILRVREYGGPDIGTGVNYEIKRKFTRALDFKGSQYIRVPWKIDTNSMVPQTIEFRFRTPYKAEQVIYKKGTDFAIQLINSGSTNYGYVRFAVSASTGVSHLDTPKLKFFNDDMWSVMLTRKSSSGADLSSDLTSQNITYELIAKQYDSTRQKILYQGSSSLAVDGTVSSSYNQKVANRPSTNFLGGDGNTWGSQQFSGSLMEFRFWSEPLSQSIFDNHVRTPKAYNGNYFSSSYDNLLLRLPLDDNKNLSTNPTASNVSHLTTYSGNISGSNVNGFTGNFSKTLVDMEQFRVPNIGPSRRNATKIRLEDTTLTGVLNPNRRREVSSYDTAPIDSNKLDVYFSPVDVVNEDIVYSIADFNFDDYIGDPRDEFKPTYKDLRDLRDEYFKRYSNSNNFWDYLRILSYYDSSVFTQLKQLVPARAKSTMGVLIEPNILERSKQVIGKKPEFDNRYYENANAFQEGIQVTRFISGSPDNVVSTFGSYDTYNGEIKGNEFSGSNLGTLGVPSLVHVNKLNPKQEFGSLYATASVEVFGPNKVFSETLTPIISGSRLAEHNDEYEYYYNTEANANRGPLYADSSSFKRSDVQSIAYSTNLYRAFYQGILLTKDNTIDGKEPIEVNQVQPTTITTQDSDISKLRTE